jgi:hypothetical protein
MVKAENGWGFAAFFRIGQLPPAFPTLVREMAMKLGSLTNPVIYSQAKKENNASFGRFYFPFRLDHEICQRT